MTTGVCLFWKGNSESLSLLPHLSVPLRRLQISLGTWRASKGQAVAIFAAPANYVANGFE